VEFHTNPIRELTRVAGSMKCNTLVQSFLKYKLYFKLVLLNKCVIEEKAVEFRHFVYV
jgi:hypothetical protein